MIFVAPPRVSLHPFSDGSYVVENFNNGTANVSVAVVGGGGGGSLVSGAPLSKAKQVRVPGRGWVSSWAPER